MKNIFFKYQTYWLTLIIVFLSVFVIKQSVLAQFNLNVGNDKVYTDPLRNPLIDPFDLNGHAIVESSTGNYYIKPSSSTGMFIFASSTYPGALAGQFDGNVEIHGGQLFISGAIIQPGSSSTLNFPGFIDTPDSYDNKTVTSSQQWSFAKRTTITVHHEKVEGNNNLLDFPMLFVGRFDMLKHRDWGGHVSSTVGEDIAFSQDANPVNTSKFLQHEKIHYNSTTGDYAAWFTPDLDYNDDTILYLFYGTDVIDNWEDPTVTWADYGGVYHMNDATDATTQNDGSFNHTPVTADDIYITNTTTTYPGSAEYSQVFDGLDDFITVPDDASLDGASGLAISAWVKRDSWTTTSGGLDYIVNKGAYGTTPAYGLFYSSGYLYWFFGHSGNKTAVLFASTASLDVNDWHLITASFDKFSDEAALFIDGVMVDQETGLKSSGLITNSINVGIGSSGDNGAGSPTQDWDDWDGQIDEVRIRDISDPWSADYDKTIMNNYLDPLTFYTVDTSDVGKLLGVTSTEDGVDFITDNSTYTELIRSLWEQSGLDIYYDLGSVTIGTGTPTGDLNLFSNSGSNAQINLQSGTNNYWGIYNDESSNTFRFWNTNQASGNNNLVISTDGKMSIGVDTTSFGIMNLDQQYFIQGNTTNTLSVYNNASGGKGIHAQGFYGAYGTTTAIFGEAIYGEAIGSGGIGVHGKGKIGVFGEATETYGAGVRGVGGLYGGYFYTASSPSVSAVYGISDETYAGVWGWNDNDTSGAGVRGEGLYGVYGLNNSPPGAGIKGASAGETGDMAGYFEGDVVLGRYETSTPVYLDLYDDATAPASADCDSTGEYGRTMLDNTNHELYMCTSSGWQVIELERCGNGIVEGNEVCDDGDLVTEGCHNGIKEVGTFCNATCSAVLNLNEACDPGGYSPDCQQSGYWWTAFAGKYCRSDCGQLSSYCLGM